MSPSLPQEDPSWWQSVYLGMDGHGRQAALGELASLAREPRCQSRLVGAGVHSFAVEALQRATREVAGPPEESTWRTQAQAARLLANLAYLPESKQAVFGAGAADALEAAAQLALLTHERRADARRHPGPAECAGGDDAISSLLLESSAALANLASGASLRARCLESDCRVIPLLNRLAHLRADIGSEAVRALSNLACLSATWVRLCEWNTPQVLLNLLLTHVRTPPSGGAPPHLPGAHWFTVSDTDFAQFIGLPAPACSSGCCREAPGGPSVQPFVNNRVGSQPACSRETTDGHDPCGSSVSNQVCNEKPPDHLISNADANGDLLSACAVDGDALRLVHKVLTAFTCLFAGGSNLALVEWAMANPAFFAAIVALLERRSPLVSQRTSCEGSCGDACFIAFVRLCREALRLCHRLVLCSSTLGVSLLDAGLLRALCSILRAHPTVDLVKHVGDFVHNGLLSQQGVRTATLSSAWLPPMLLAAALVVTRATGSRSPPSPPPSDAVVLSEVLVAGPSGATPPRVERGTSSSTASAGGATIVSRLRSSCATAVASTAPPPVAQHSSGPLAGSAPLRSFSRRSGSRDSGCSSPRCLGGRRSSCDIGTRAAHAGSTRCSQGDAQSTSSTPLGAADQQYSSPGSSATTVAPRPISTSSNDAPMTPSEGPLSGINGSGLSTLGKRAPDAEMAEMCTKMREMAANIESWQPGTFSALIDGGASDLWSPCRSRQGAALVALAVVAWSPTACAAISNSHALPRCTQLLTSQCESQHHMGGIPSDPSHSDSESSNQEIRVCALVVLSTLTLVVRGYREASVALALDGAIPLLQRLACNEGRSAPRVRLAAELLLFEMSTHVELVGPCLKHRVLSMAVCALLRPVPQLRRGEQTATARADRVVSQLDSARRAVMRRPPLSQVSGAKPREGCGFHASYEAFSLDLEDVHAMEWRVRHTAAAAVRVLTSPQQALLPLLAHGEVYASLQLLEAASTGRSTQREDTSHSHGKVSSTSASHDDVLDDAADDAREAMALASEVADRLEDRLREHCSRQRWLLYSMFTGADSRGLAWPPSHRMSDSRADGAVMPSSPSSSWRAAGGELRTPGSATSRFHSGRLPLTRLHAALMLIRFSPSSYQAVDRKRSTVGGTDVQNTVSSLLPLLLRHLVSPEASAANAAKSTTGRAPNYSSAVYALSNRWASGAAAAMCIQPESVSDTTHVAECAAAEEARGRAACASVMLFAIKERIAHWRPVAPLSWHSAAAVVAALGEQAAPTNSYVRALIESQVGIVLESL